MYSNRKRFLLLPLQRTIAYITAIYYLMVLEVKVPNQGVSMT